MALTIKNKQGSIDGTLDKPTHNVDERIQWERCNMLVKAWFLGAMIKEISKSVMHCSTTSDMWMELKERFSHTNTVQLSETEKSILECRQGNSSVTTYFTRLKALWDEKESICEFPACTCAAAAEVKKYVETQKAMQFLMGLGDNFWSLRSTIINIDPLLPTNKIYAMALRHEKQGDIPNTKQSVTVEASAFHTKKHDNLPSYKKNSSAREGGAFGQRCEICKYTHTAKNFRAHIKFTHCLGQGHSENYCKWKRMGHSRSTQPPSSYANNTIGGHQGDTKPSLPHEDSNHVIKLLNKIKSGKLDIEGRKLLELLNTTTTSSANLVGNVSNYNDYAGFALGEDDWDGQ